MKTLEKRLNYWAILDDDRDLVYIPSIEMLTAAPEMYAAIMAVHDIINSYSHIPAIAEACRKLQAAIAAAEVKP